MLVGKGITFDTGGLSIKTAEGMTTMKRDMTGGGVVIAVLGALAALGCRLRVTGLVASAENAIGGDALRPGDVVTHFGGRTSEVNNTDAEGRLVLADALAYAVAGAQARRRDRRRDPHRRDAGGAGQQHRRALRQQRRPRRRRWSPPRRVAGEPVWRMPLAADYEERLSSKVADADNAPGGPGAITAALFLQHFVGDVPWAHFDLASVGRLGHRRLRVDAPGRPATAPVPCCTWLGSDEPLRGIR